jgi:hypothetical protein
MGFYGLCSAILKLIWMLARVSDIACDGGKKLMRPTPVTKVPDQKKALREKSACFVFLKMLSTNSST